MIKNLKKLDNTILLIEHDLDIIKKADWIIEMGPKAGLEGGRVVFSGKINNLKKNKSSITAKYLFGEESINIPSKRRKFNKVISIKGAKKNNLININCDIPLNVITAITGVSGSGKSSLIHDCFYGKEGYTPILKGHIVKNKFTLTKNKNKIKFSSFDVSHGKIKSRAYVFNKTAYLSDCDGIYTKDIKKLLNLKYLIIDCLKINPHPSHFNLNQAIETSNILKPKKTILTNLHTDLDYNFLKKKLPKNIIPAYDGLSLSI